MRVVRVRPQKRQEERNADRNRHNFRGEPLAAMLDAEGFGMDEFSCQAFIADSVRLGGPR